MFEDRYDAAQQLASLLKEYASNPNAIIIAIPRGGLELGFVLAKELHLPLDVLFAKKLTLPSNPEYAIGAVTQDDLILSEQFRHIPELQPHITQQAAQLRQLMKQRAQQYRKDMGQLELQDKIVIVVDDGVATGNTMIALLQMIRTKEPQKIIVALPVCPPDTLERLKQYADDIQVLLVPVSFSGVGQFYRHFAQVEDEQANRLLHEANKGS